MMAIKCSLPEGRVLCYYQRGLSWGGSREIGAGGPPTGLWGVLLYVHLVCCSGQVRSHFFLCKMELVVLCNACVDL